MKRYEALDGLRGIAAVMVIFYHYSLDFFEPVGIFRDNFLTATSYAFVDLFFVLSGFVISLNYFKTIQNRSAFNSYLVKRFARLYPLLLFTVSIYVVLKAYAFYSGFAFDTSDYGPKDFIIDILEPLTFLNSTPIISTSAGMNPVSWSISAEMIAYVIFGLTVLSTRRPMLVFYGLIVTSVLFIWKEQRFMFASDFGFIRGILGFSVGVVTYRYQNFKRFFKGFWQELSAILFILMSFYWIHNSSTELTNLILPAVFFYTIMVFTNESGAISKVLKSNFFQFLGRISYSVYLNHFIILWVYYELVWKLIGFTPNRTLAWIGIILILITVGITSYFSYELIEKKGMRKIRAIFQVQ